MKVPVPADLPEHQHEAYCLAYWFGFKHYEHGPDPESRAAWPEPYDAGYLAALSASMNWRGNDLES